jgi:amino acid transporter
LPLGRQVAGIRSNEGVRKRLGGWGIRREPGHLCRCFHAKCPDDSWHHSLLAVGLCGRSAGLGKALVIIALANLISILTSVSLSAVATNLRVKGGGDYYLISRTLGVEFGGSIGLVLFLAQSVSIAFYCIGFAEAVTGFIPPSGVLNAHVIAYCAVAFLFVLAWLGADWATKFQYIVMALLLAALVSFFWGGISQWDSALLKSNWTGGGTAVPFWVLFAIFFPAVTGFTQGVSMSGDLKDPGKSLPAGTFLAVGVSILVYFGTAVVFAAAMPNAELSAGYDAMQTVSRYGFLIDAGVVAATLSSAMASFMGAPRILQSLSADRVFPFLNLFAKGSGPTNNPRRGILLSGAIAVAVITLGQLNLVARVVSMFFLISYGLLNYASFFESRIASPSFLPRFKWFSPKLCLVGFLLCAGTMMAIDLRSGAAAIAVLFAIHQYLKRTTRRARWADSSRAYHLQQTRLHMLAASAQPAHDRDWQPRLLVLNHGPENQEALLAFSSWIEGGAGFAVAVHIHEGEGVGARKKRDELQRQVAAFIAENKWPIFPLTVCASDFSEALCVLVQSAGFGPLSPNTVLLNGFDPSGGTIPCTDLQHYVHHLRSMFRLGMNVMALHSDPERWLKLQKTAVDERRIDVWWHDDATGRLMLLLAYLMTRQEAWNKASIRVLNKGSENNLDAEKERLKQQLDDARIEATGFIVESFAPDVVLEHSADASIVFLPFTVKAGQMLDDSGGSYEAYLPNLPMAILALAAEDIDLDAEPEEGAYARLAEADDRLDVAKAIMEKAEKASLNARKNFEKLAQELARHEAEGAGGKQEELEEKVVAAEAEAEKAQHHAENAQAKAEDAEKKADAIVEETLTDKSKDAPS